MSTRVVLRKNPPGAGHLVAVGAGIGVNVRVGVCVSVGDGVIDGTWVGPDGVRVAVPTVVGVDVIVGLSVFVAVAVIVEVTVAVGDGRTIPRTVEQATLKRLAKSASVIKKRCWSFIVWGECGSG